MLKLLLNQLLRPLLRLKLTTLGMATIHHTITAMDGQAILSLAARGVLLMLKLLLNQLLRQLLRLKLTTLGMATTHLTITAMDGQAILSLAARGVLLMLSLKLIQQHNQNIGFLEPSSPSTALHSSPSTAAPVLAPCCSSGQERPSSLQQRGCKNHSCSLFFSFFNSAEIYSFKRCFSLKIKAFCK